MPAANRNINKAAIYKILSTKKDTLSVAATIYNVVVDSL